MAMILVTGAAGKTGQAVIKRLVAKGQPVRGLVRRQEQVVALEQLGVVEVVSGDITMRRTLEHAAEGARAIYHICPNMHPDEETIGKNAIGAAQSAGIEHFVYHSVLHPQVEAMAHHWQKMRVEEMLFESGLSYHDSAGGGIHAECAGELGAHCQGWYVCGSIRAGNAAEYGR